MNLKVVLGFNLIFKEEINFVLKTKHFFLDFPLKEINCLIVETVKIFHKKIFIVLILIEVLEDKLIKIHVLKRNNSINEILLQDDRVYRKNLLVVLVNFSGINLENIVNYFNISMFHNRINVKIREDYRV